MQANGRNSGISNHILPVSATMVGVCMTVVSVIQLIPRKSVAPWADGLLAMDSLVFLASVMLSYWSLRHPKMALRAEHYADRLFLFGLGVMVVVNFVIAFELF